MRISHITFLAYAFFAAISAFASKSRFGVCAHLNRWEFDVLGQELKIMRDAGIGVVRVDLDWGQVRPNPKESDYSRWDKVVENAAAEGVEILAILGGSPHFARVPSGNLEAWTDYVGGSVERYKGKVKYWEVFNEANLAEFWRSEASPEGYFELLKVSCETIKKIDPTAVVLLSGLGGIPEKYLDQLLSMGAGKYFDVLNIHPYDFNFPPEAFLEKKLLSLKELMQKHGVQNKPVWITEIGNSSGYPDKGIPKLFERALERLGIDPDNDKVCTIADNDYFYESDGLSGSSKQILPQAKNVKAVKFSEIKNLVPLRDKALILAGSEFFPHEFLNDLYAYVFNGGTLILSGGMPFYYDIKREGDEISIWNPEGNDGMKWFRISAKPFWKMDNVPEKADSVWGAEGYGDIEVGGKYASYFATCELLKDGDSFEPVLNAKIGDKTFPVGGIYKFNSDMKGNVVVFYPKLDEVTTEEMQAALLPRAFLIAYSQGIERIFAYNFRSNETDNSRESHFGLMRKNLDEKPAYYAYKTLISLLGPDFSNLKIIRKDGVYLASWLRSDGNRAYGIWSVAQSKNILVSVLGKIDSAYNTFGEKMHIPNGRLKRIEADKNIKYIIGPKDIAFKF